MKMQLSAGFLGLTHNRDRRIMIFFAFLFFSLGVYKEVWGEEKDEVKKQIQELRQQMEDMEKKLRELEEENKKLE